MSTRTKTRTAGWAVWIGFAAALLALVLPASLDSEEKKAVPVPVKPVEIPPPVKPVEIPPPAKPAARKGPPAKAEVKPQPVKPDAQPAIKPGGSAPPTPTPIRRPPVNPPPPQARPPLVPSGTHALPPGGKELRGRYGPVVTDRGGRPRVVPVRDGAIEHRPDGNRRIEVRRPDGKVFVTNGAGNGYVEHGFTDRGHVFVQRTYYVRGVSYVQVYQPYKYRGVAVNVYVPGRYYAPAFYGWAYNPWGGPVVYTSWGWAGSPWYGVYGPAYFTPYPVYTGAGPWLTDYLVADSFQGAYQAKVDAGSQPVYSAPVPLTPDVKEAISSEVQRQIALENAERQNGTQTPPDPLSSGINRMLTDKSPHVFVVASALNLISEGGECAVTEGDVLQLNDAPPAAAVTADLVVLYSKGGCPKGIRVSVGLKDLQDMQNHMRETINRGFGELQAKQGQDGLPPIPPPAKLEPEKASFVDHAPPPEPNIADELSQQAKDAIKEEQDVLTQALPGSGPGAPESVPEPPQTATIAPGMTVDQVVGILGQPVRNYPFRNKVIYVFKDVRVTFQNGKAIDIQ